MFRNNKRMGRIKQIVLIGFIVIAVVACKNTQQVSGGKFKVKKELTKDDEQQYYYIFIEANRKKLLGDLNGASALYYQCLEINPESAAAMSEISEINKITKNYDIAEKYALLAIENDAENKWYQLNLAHLYVEINNLEKAAGAYEKLHNKYSNDIEITYTLANIYSYSQEFKKAVELYNEIESVAGISEQLSITKQRLYYQLGEKTKAYKEIEKLVKHYPNEAGFYGILAEMYTNDNLFSKAEENYNKLFELDSTNSIGQISIIDFYRKKMDYDNAFLMLEKVILNETTDFGSKVRIFVSILNTQSELKIYNEKIRESISILKNHYPDEKDTHTLNADFLIKTNLIDEAKVELKYITENYSSNVIVWEQLLSIYSYNSNFDTLYIASKTAIDSFPEHSLFYIFRGVSATRINKTTEAIEILEKGLKTTPNDSELLVDFYTYLGEAYYEINDYKKSDYYFDQVLVKEPDNLYVINNYSYYLSLREEKLEFAETISKKTVIAEPNNSTYLDTYAWILFKLERYHDALLYIKQAVESGGVDSEVIIEHYGDILFMTGDKSSALEFWKLSESMGNTSEELKSKIESKEIK
jgi:tetratricopeptide (TPR) repeat protein